ncbi:MAG: hypothetical protein ACI9FU_000853, partial [Granulosicoccus sp.]
NKTGPMNMTIPNPKRNPLIMAILQCILGAEVQYLEE